MDNIYIDHMNIGQQVEVYWPQDEEYYAWKVTKKRKLQAENKVKGSTKSTRYEYFIKYDDGDAEWVDLDSDDLNIRFANKNLYREKRQNLMDEASKLKLHLSLLQRDVLEGIEETHQK
eukprot:CAMPEP_0203727756 /NCGR_PEP_ID=MMETSP0092-20131115/11828_1 /ASSEMBLY_ACC=CAM_ASM_001090 /TAXON_ID=426623 /ORGANISM="Chaetoceros affinis, Strain CCMP159" /LENGTH=117 /DNA_ID=CAMNT_0050609515 /DNA_START=372 /DNA_END=725 /DNA_ORIENTATION=+